MTRTSLVRQVLQLLLGVVPLVTIGCGGDLSQASPTVPSAADAQVASAALSAPPTLIYAGTSFSLELVTRNAAGVAIAPGAVLWASSAPSVATVGQDGAVRAISPGTATITVSAASSAALLATNGRSASVAITVASAPAAAPDRGVDWATYNGDFQHTGYVNLTIDPARLRQLFDVSVYPTSKWHQPTTGAGRVYLTSQKNVNDTARVAALDGRTGAILWQRSVYDNDEQSQFSYDGTSLFFTSANLAWALDPVTGAPRWRTIGPSDPQQYLAPVIAGNALVSAGARDLSVPSQYAGGFTGYDRITGRQLYSVRDVGGHTPWTPAVRNTLVYTVLGGVQSFDSNDGSLRSRFIVPTRLTDGTFSISASGTLVTLQGYFPGLLGQQLVGVDLINDRKTWSVTSSYFAMPVMASGIVYTAAADHIEARSEVDGTLEWTFALDDKLPYYPHQLIVANNVLISSSNWSGSQGTTTFIDLSTHQLLLNYPRGGEIAISRDGILYVTSQDRLAAVALW